MAGSYFSPGVYVEDVPPSSRPIAGVGTSTAGFIGVVANNVTMPTRPGSATTWSRTRVRQVNCSWNDFVTHFGEVQAGNTHLAHAVFGFFHNGGTRCWVIRVALEADLTTSPDELNEFAAIDEIAIVAAPGVTSQAVQQALLDHCKNNGDRVAVLDGVKTPATSTATDISTTARSESGSYGAVYFPWIVVNDPTSTTGGTVVVAPSGHVAGIYARNDATRGVHKAPANEVVMGALGLGTSDQQGPAGRLESGRNQRHPRIQWHLEGLGWSYARRRGSFRVPLHQHSSLHELFARVD